MDKVCKKLLKRMHSDGAPERFEFRLFSDSMQTEADLCGVTIEEFSNAVKALVADGLAEYVFTKNGFKSCVKLTHKGVHYKEYIVSERIKTFVVPAVVSVITTLSTLAVKDLWPLIRQWLSNTL